ncbi:TPA: hypothetical protein UOA80_001075 [Stenotrophomonas maltophilia]|uniref:Uncharacterized protein n=1 Tax=Stenotrophomonas maltophilia TaxID=40324 RepID=A0AAI9C2C1_STEMA|nr:hypothetical protein [Stenotrophomonas maltophilia]HEL4101083.1 hypothetical protein [Stenotrophomonas maltophilia]HEL5043501.1 hypothetical protein [Stenotrophomonas maltophilia]
MNPRETMARLGPSTVKFDIGRGGGKPDLTNQDIAAALGMVPAGLGRELLEACWWPDGAALRRHKLRDAVIALVTPELQRQQRRLAEARTDLGLAEVCMGWGGGATAEQRANRDAAQQRLGRIKAQCWPISTLESLPTLAAAVISEIAKRPHCAACEGRGQAMRGELLVPCKVCGGSGLGPVSDRRRAAAIGRDEAAYRRTWKPVFEWLVSKMTEAEQEAAWHLRAALDQAA